MYDSLSNFNIAVDKEDLESAVDEQTTRAVFQTEEQHDKILAYLLARVASDKENRLRRVKRFAAIDQSISTWQRLSPEDSKRVSDEENSGRSQGIPMNVPIIKSNLEDTTSFLAEIFAPVGGNYYADPSKRDKTEPLKLLTRKMNEDSKHNDYYAEVAQAMSSLFKYNITGFTVEWQPEDEIDRAAGNRIHAIDLYNLFYDPAVLDVHKLHKDGEWVAIATLRSRLWLLREKEKRQLLNLDKVLLDSSNDSNVTERKAVYYRYPPMETNITSDGSDSKTGFGTESDKIDWSSLGFTSDSSAIAIPGHEVIKMHCWLSRKQFKLGTTLEDFDTQKDLGLFCFEIVDGKYIISAVEVTPDLNELPIYLSRMTRDELREADRSTAEHIKPFQRFVSFLMNTHVAGVRSNIWGITVFDPSMLDSTKLKAGDVAAWIPTKIGGRDVGTAAKKIQSNVDTSGTMRDAATVMELIKQFYPNQAMPSQVASIDRAVSNQVSAVLQGSVRKLHMFCRIIDAGLMRNVRIAQFRNLAAFDVDKKQLTGLRSEEISTLLSSGLGQLTREAAAGQLQSLIFTLLQNPDSAQRIDMPALWTVYSGLLNIGVDLGEFALPPAQPPQQVPDDGQMVLPGVQS